MTMILMVMIMMRRRDCRDTFLDTSWGYHSPPSISSGSLPGAPPNFTFLFWTPSRT